MAYSELIKSFDKIRNYLREFYIYGFKSRTEYTNKSARSYDDQRRRLESWFENNISSRHSVEGKHLFISIDSRLSEHNPLFKAWKTKSFTDGDISLHFILFDILQNPVSFNINDLMNIISQEYLSYFENAREYDESTIRKKLKEYISLGLIRAEKQGKQIFYSLAKNINYHCNEALDFYCETAPCGVIGSYILDKNSPHKNCFSFKHHYIHQTTDSEILLKILLSIKNHSEVKIKSTSRKGSINYYTALVPLKVFISVQSGRQYIMTYQRKSQRFRAFRLDYISEVTEQKPAEDFLALREMLQKIQPHIWGVSTQGSDSRMETVEFIIHFNDNEEYILNRLQREKRCGKVELLDKNTAKFSAEIFDSSELVPWIRTFICRIQSVQFSNISLQKRFLQDIKEMYELYDLNNGENENVIQ